MLGVGKVHLEASCEGWKQEVPLRSGTAWTIGRSAENAVVCPDKSMSRRHAVIQQTQPGKFHFVDLGSSNGSSLNGRRITVPIELRDGDSVLCGGTHITFRESANESSATSRAQTGGSTVALSARHLITVLVVDIRDFSPLARQLDEAVLAQTLGTWFRQSGAILRRHGASEEKFIGDAVMAVWQHSFETPKAPEICNILKALLEIESSTRTLDQQFPLPAPLRVGAGVSTGNSITDHAGPPKNPDFNPLGDTSAEGFLLEAATKKSGFDVALGRTTIECLGGGSDLARLFEKRPVEMKGYQQPVEAWFTSFDKLRDFLAVRAAK